MLPRIRTVKPEFFRHAELFDAERETGLPLRLAYVGLWCCADREGRFEWRPRELGVVVLPYEGIDFSRVLDALVTRGWVVRYEAQGRTFGFIPTFTKHQTVNPRERASEIPEPPVTPAAPAASTRESRVPETSSTRAHAGSTGTGTPTGTGTTSEENPLPPSEAGARQPRKTGQRSVEDELARDLAKRLGSSHRTCRNQVNALLVAGWDHARIRAAIQGHAEPGLDPWDWTKRARGVPECANGRRRGLTPEEILRRTHGPEATR